MRFPDELSLSVQVRRHNSPHQWSLWRWCWALEGCYLQLVASCGSPKDPHPQLQWALNSTVQGGQRDEGGREGRKKKFGLAHPFWRQHLLRMLLEEVEGWLG